MDYGCGVPQGSVGQDDDDMSHSPMSKRPRIFTEDSGTAIDFLPDELYLEIMAMLPTFEDRYVLGMVCKRWKSIYRKLLRPENDEMASVYLNLPWLSDDDESCGPSFVDWTSGYYSTSLPVCAYQFYYGGKCVVQLFGLYSLDHVHCCYQEGKRFFAIYKEKGTWMMSYRCANLTEHGYRRYATIKLPHPDPNGDVFDQVLRVKDAFNFANTNQEERDLLPDQEEWKNAVCFNAALARRIYNYPYFVKKRKELEDWRRLQ